eukprot:gene11537-11680_t
MRFVTVPELVVSIRAIDDPVLRGKIQKALHMLHRTLELYRCAHSGLGGLSTFYFERSDDFPEVWQFVKDTNDVYGLRMHFLTHPDFKAGLEEYLKEAHTAAIVLGTRRGDPNAEGQEYFCPSSAGWPPFMRINPILDWSYADVWGFLRCCQLPYCCLYDQGYTSLGGVHNTLPNSALLKSDGKFAPAYILADGRLERAGRATKQAVIVPDDVSAIASEVAALSASCQAVITSGGVGPTLDDVTMEGIAAAFGVDLIRHPDLEESLLRYFGDHTTPAHLKMADAPGDDTTRLIHYCLDSGGVSPFPLVAVRNVFVLPGVPHLLQQKWPAVAAELQAAVQLAPFSNRVVRLLSEDEAAVAPLLDTLAAEWGSEISIGSYPVSGQSDGARLLVILESKQADRLNAALGRFKELLPSGVAIAVQTDVSCLSGQSGASSGNRRNSFGSLCQAAGYTSPTGIVSPAGRNSTPVPEAVEEAVNAAATALATAAAGAENS